MNERGDGWADELLHAPRNADVARPPAAECSEMPRKLKIEKRVMLAFWLALCALAIAGFASYASTARYIDNSEKVLRARDVLSSVRLTRSEVQDAEIGQRGYILTGRADYLSPYHDAIAHIPKRLDDLRELTADD